VISSTVSAWSGRAGVAIDFDGRADVDSDDGVHDYNVARCVAMLPIRM
jgi:hypothetical protein